MIEWILSFNTPTVIVGLFVSAAVLVIVDYLFPADWPCQIGYLCFATGVFFVVHFSPLLSLVTALAVWIGLIGLHFTLFHHFLSDSSKAKITSNVQPAGESDEN